MFETEQVAIQVQQGLIFVLVFIKHYDSGDGWTLPHFWVRWDDCRDITLKQNTDIFVVVTCRNQRIIKESFIFCALPTKIFYL